MFVTDSDFNPHRPLNLAKGRPVPPDVTRRTRPYFRKFFALCKKHEVTMWNEHEPMEHMEHMSNYFEPAFGIKPGEP